MTEWLAAAGDVSFAYVSSRSSDDPATYGRIVIIVQPDDKPTYFIDTPKATKLWVVHPYCRERDVGLFGSLREALNSIRPVLPDPFLTASADLKGRIGRQGRLAKIAAKRGRSNKAT